jgi:peptidyl-prolyl cis-trans isomerase C
MKQTLSATSSALFTALLLGALALPASVAQAQNLAVVNGKPIPTARVELLARQVLRGQPPTPEIMDELKQAVIDRELLAQEARRLGLAATPEYRAQIEFAQESLLIRELVANFQETHPITEADFQEGYQRFVAANGGKEYHARHILVASEAEAQALLAQLKKGAKFDTLAKQHSKDPGSAARGGDLDWAPAQGYVPEFANALMAMDKGQTSEAPVQTQFGWHLIHVVDLRDIELPSLEEIKPQLAQEIGQHKFETFQQDLRNKAKIK